MKAKTICAIKNMLEEWNENAYIDYRSYSQYLEDKYGVEYNVLVDEDEKEKWLDMRDALQDSKDVLNDFKNHTWK